MKTTLLPRVEATLQKYKMLAPDEQVLVACSGGPDSVALFHALRELTPPWSLRLALVHFDHALRHGSRADLRFVRKLARDFDTPFYAKRSPARVFQSEKDLSPEERARKRRYDFFKEVSRKTRIRKIALGHHQDDQAETILMRILQGTGLRGLRGIRPVIKSNGLTFIRPLWEVSREQILTFLKNRKLSYRRDPSNVSPRFPRNRIRHRLLPLLEKEYNPQIRKALCRLAETATAESEGLDEWIKGHWREHLRSRKNGMLRLDRDRFLSLPPALQFRLLDRMLRELKPRSGLDFEAWQRIEAGLRNRRYRLTLPRNLHFILTPQKLFLKKK